MAEATTPSSADLDRAAEETGFYHEAALNATWTGSRLALGGLAFLFGAFAFAYFYLRSVNSGARWHGSGFHSPNMIMGTVIMFLVVLTAASQYTGLQRIKAGNKAAWQIAGVTALILGVAAVVLQIIELLFLPFWPGSSGYSSLFTGFYPVFLVIVLSAMVWLEILLVGSRAFPAISFVEEPPTFAEAMRLQRFQANLSAFTALMNFLAVVSIFFWILFYVV